jgi:hypothetical protein
VPTPAAQPAWPPQTPPAKAAPAPGLPPRQAPLDQAFAEFASDPAFATQPPTREQVARAWASAAFQIESDHPNHAEVIAAFRKLFPPSKSQ